MSEPGTVWRDVVGQDAAVAALRRAAAAPVHAYLFVGPPGSTKAQAARAFAAVVLTGADDPTSRDARLVLAGEHPDVREVERAGAAILMPQAREIVRQAGLAPIEGQRKVLILHEFHLLSPEAAGVMLKTIEEPTASTHFVVLADFIPNDLVTIASRCVQIEFSPIPEAVLVERLVAEGVDSDRAQVAAAAAGGNVDRARLLVADDEFVARRDAFAAVPGALDGTGSAVVATVADLLGRIEAAAAPLTERHAREIEVLEAREKQLGTRGSGRGLIEARHKREQRRHRTDELRSGLAVIAGVYRDALIAESVPHPDSVVDAVHRIHEAIEALDNNPNETLLLQSLLWSFPPLTSGSATSRLDA